MLNILFFAYSFSEYFVIDVFAMGKVYELNTNTYFFFR